MTGRMFTGPRGVNTMAGNQPSERIFRMIGMIP
jgi:hypothetical protein